MNFESFKAKAVARVKEQAAIAADAARSVSNFDAMAANDDYIHHDDLRTPDDAPTREELLRKATTISNSRSRSPSNTTTRSKSPSSATVVGSSNRSRPPNRTQHSTRINAAAILSQASQFSSMVSSDDDDEDGGEVERKVKNPNRFMHDLDQRLSRPEEVLAVQEDPQQQPVAMTPLSLSSSQAKLPGWLKSPVMANMLAKLQSPTTMATSSVVTTGRSEERQPMIVGPLSSRWLQPDNDNQQQHDDEEDPMEHHVVVSSSMLGADEQAELMRMAQSTTARSDPLTALLTTIKQNPQFAFILFTLVLGYVVYFYSRHKEEIDDVT